MSSRITAPIRASAGSHGRRREVPSGASGVPGVATGSVATCSLDNAPSTHRSAASAALVPILPASSADLLDGLEEPADEPVDHHRAGTGPDEEADDHEDREGSELLVGPVPDQHAQQGRDEE